MNIRLISSDLKLFNRFELTKIAIEFFCKNLQRHKYTTKEKEELVRYFNKRLHMKVEWNQTS